MKIIPLPVSQSSGTRYNKEKISDEKIIMGIINHHDKVIERVYNEYHRKIKKMVYTFRNSALDPDDIFQEGLTRAIMNIREGKFKGDSSFLTYLNGICRNICLKELSKQKTGSLGAKDFISEHEDTNYELLVNLLKVRENFDWNCLKIIDLRFGLGEEENKGSAFEEIASKLDISPENARQRFKRCLDKLRDIVFKDHELRNFFNQ